jgi:hypothetical protein
VRLELTHLACLYLNEMIFGDWSIALSLCIFHLLWNVLSIISSSHAIRAFLEIS